MTTFRLIFLFVWLSYPLFSQERESHMNFSLLRQNDAISIEEPNNFYQNLKYLQLSEKTTLSFGGSYRFQTEGFINEQFNADVDNETDTWFLHRIMMHSHLKVSDRFEIFAELNSSLISSKENITPVDKDELNVNQLFAQYFFTEDLSVLLGRQNVRLGSGRLVDIREGPNVRLSFDMVQLQYQKNKTSITAFHSIPVQQEEGLFDNDFLNNSETLSALYWHEKWSGQNKTDVYLLYKTEENKTWNIGTADDHRLSFGLRHFGNWKSFRFNNEFVYQFGSFGDMNISAWTASFNIEKDFSFGTLGIKTEAISGDRNGTMGLNTFDAIYPRGAYFGRVARFGPSNLIDFHPYYDFKLGEFNLEVDYVAFWRFSLDDGIYGPSLILDYPDTNNQRFIGHQVGSILSREVNKHLAFEFESNVIFPGGFLKASQFNDSLFHFVFTTEIKF